MAMVVKNNMSAVSTLNTLNKNSSALQKSLQKVSSGMKINSAQDDASGYAISEKMRVQIRSLDQANQNTQNASSMMKTAEGAVSSTVEILKSLKEKAINAATDTNTDSDRVTIQKELDQFIDQIDDNALTTFNGKYLIDGSKSQLGKATNTAMTNQSMATDTAGTSKLIELKNRNNESLEIESTDYVTASFVKNGATYTTKFLVGDGKTLDDVFSNLNDTYNQAQKAAGVDTDTSDYKTAFAGTATSSSSGTGGATGSNPTTDTTAAAATIAAVSEADILAVANGSNVDTSDALVQALALQASTLAGDVSTAETAATTKITGAITSSANYQAAPANASGIGWSTYDTTTHAAVSTTGGASDSASDTATAAAGVLSEAKKAVEDYASGGNTTVTSAAGAAELITTSVKQTGYTPYSTTPAAAAYSTPANVAAGDTDIGAYATAVLKSAAGAAAAALFGGGTTTASDYKAVDGTDITKDNADTYLMKSSDVEELAANYGVSRYDSDTDETFAARTLEAIVGAPKSTDSSKNVGDNDYVTEYPTNSLNSITDTHKQGQDEGSEPDYDGVYFDTTQILAYDATSGEVTGKMSDASKIKEGYNKYVNSTNLGNGDSSAIDAAYSDAVKVANHLSALNANNAVSGGIVNTVTQGSSDQKADTYSTAATTETGLIGVNSAGDNVYTADGTAGLTITAAGSGVQGQISGVTISISDSEGNVKKSANAALDNFRTTIYAKNVSDSNELSFQVGANANQSIAVGLEDMRSEALGLKGSDGSKVSVATQDKANAAVAVFDNAIQKALDQQTTIGAVEARLDYTSQNLTTSSENVQAAESTIRDADMAKEMTNYTKNNVLLQAAQSMLAQANQSSSAVLSLLQ